MPTIDNSGVQPKMNLGQVTKLAANKLVQNVAKKSAISPTTAYPNLSSVNYGTNTVNTTPSNIPSTNFSQTNAAKLGALTTDYGGSTKYEKFHPGIDIANKIGASVPAFAPGTVTEVVTGKKQGDKGFGNYVIVTDAQGNKHRYSHLYNAWVKVGQKVNEGQNIASIGNTGSTYSNSGGTGAHLDYRIRDAYNKYISPYKFFKKTSAV